MTRTIHSENGHRPRGIQYRRAPTPTPPAAPSLIFAPPCADPVRAARGHKPEPCTDSGRGSSGDISDEDEYRIKVECKNAILPTVQQGQDGELESVERGVDSAGNPGTFRPVSSTAPSPPERAAPLTSCTAIYHKQQMTRTRPGLSSLVTKTV